MAEAAKHPFEGYTLYVVYHKKEDRTMAQLVKSSTDRTTMSYARYLMSVHLGRLLTKDEHVDHINDNKNDDRIENFQLLTQKENSEKYNRLHPAPLHELMCPVCTSVFYRTKQRVKQGKQQCCSRVCGYKYAANSRIKRDGKITSRVPIKEINQRTAQRQQEILELLKLGLKRKHIVSKMGLSKTTVARYIRELTSQEAVSNNAAVT